MKTLTNIRTTHLYESHGRKRDVFEDVPYDIAMTVSEYDHERFFAADMVIEAVYCNGQRAVDFDGNTPKIWYNQEEHCYVFIMPDGVTTRAESYESVYIKFRDFKPFVDEQERLRGKYA